MGTLQVHGTLDPNQFWPTGTSDGDTAQIKVKRVTFNRKVTHALDHTEVHGRVRKPVIDEHGTMTVRFQGIDAPELHYMPQVPTAKARRKNATFRQHYGRTAAQALGGFLRGLGTGTVKCRVVTEVLRPNDVFDAYGRFVGDVIVTGKNGKDVDLNLWMAEKGWAFPAFYASMSDAEISKLRAAAAVAAKNERGVWKGYHSKVTFDRALLSKDAKGARDAGAVNMPKIFRALAFDWVSTGNTKLHAFLATEPNADRCYKTDEFLQQGITVAKQHDLVGLVLDTRIEFKPGDLVFQEAASTLFDARGERVVGW